MTLESLASTSTGSSDSLAAVWLEKKSTSLLWPISGCGFFFRGVAEILTCWKWVVNQQSWFPCQPIVNLLSQYLCLKILEGFHDGVTSEHRWVYSWGENCMMPVPTLNENQGNGQRSRHYSKKHCLFVLLLSFTCVYFWKEVLFFCGKRWQSFQIYAAMWVILQRFMSTFIPCITSISVQSNSGCGTVKPATSGYSWTRKLLPFYLQNIDIFR